VREPIPSARIAAPALVVAAARARRGVGIVFSAGVHVVRAAVIVGGFATMMWFAAASSTRSHVVEPDRVQKILDANTRQLPLGYNIHRVHLLDLMSHAENISHHRDGASLASE